MHRTPILACLAREHRKYDGVARWMVCLPGGPPALGGNLLPLLGKSQDSCKSALASEKICKPKTRKWHFHARKFQREMDGNLQAETPEQISCKISCAGRSKFLYTIYTLISGTKLVYNRCYTLIWVPCTKLRYKLFTLFLH